jgi:hypothetical protein
MAVESLAEVNSVLFACAVEEGEGVTLVSSSEDVGDDDTSVLLVRPTDAIFVLFMELVIAAAVFC